ncbi:hypothetical protein [Saccharolobus sp. A20]|uniref:hypothetical protein n=1 Tax=Saccharolobus sp. A20 TaxID=1891280 RepID=UPI000AB7655B|nr:hypothetical protein [Sulfolobus sp. A20]
MVGILENVKYQFVDSHKLDLEGIRVWVRQVYELPILGYPRNLSFYKDWEVREVSLEGW